MKRFSLFLCVFLIVLSLALPAFATAGEGNSSSSGETSSEPVVVPEVNVYNEVVVESGEDLGEYVGTSVYALSPVTSSDATGLKAVMLSLIGDYDAIVIEHEYENNNGYTSYVREIQLDYPWLCSCAIFLVVLFCILRGGFSVLCKK